MSKCCDLLTHPWGRSVEFDNSFEVPLPPAEAWPVLMDIRGITPCMPGAQLTEPVGWQLSGATISATGQQKATRHAVDADITNAGEFLRNEITVQYLNSLQAVAQTEVARQQVQRNADFLALARAKYQVGQSTMLDVRQAEVLKGQSDVALLRAQQTENEAKLDLYRRMGVSLSALPETVELTDSFPVIEPQYDQNQLLTLAREENPSLKALHAREIAANWGVRAAKSRFLPSLSASARR